MGLAAEGGKKKNRRLRGFLEKEWAAEFERNQESRGFGIERESFFRREQKEN